MMLRYYIKIGTYRVLSLEKITVKKSIETLCDTASIVMPAMSLNKSVNIESQIKVDDPVIIAIGYDKDLVPEFNGYVSEISVNNSSITIDCEDSLHLFNVELKDVELKNVSITDVLQHIVAQVHSSLTVQCDYEFNYSKYVIYKATGKDVLKKIQEETKANIYFKDKVLHVHPQYSAIVNDKPVIFDFTKNIEKSGLIYKTADERKILLEVESVAADGTRIQTTVGKPGGDKRSVKVYGVYDIASLKSRALEELSRIVYTGYEGNFTGWLQPYVEPAYNVKLIDYEYPEREGNYYVVATDTRFGSSGGERVVTLGRKIGVN